MISEPIGPTQNAGVLLDTLSRSGAELLLRVVDDLADGTAVAVAQEGEVTLAPKLTFEDGRIDWVQPAESVHARIRGVTPEPGAHTLHGDDRLKILESAVARTASRMPPGHLRLDGRRLLVGTASDPIELLAVQPAGRRAMSAPDWWRGRLADAGTVLS